MIELVGVPIGTPGALLTCFVLFSLLHLTSAYVASEIAKEVNRERHGLWAGLIFGPVGCLVAMLMQERQKREAAPSVTRRAVQTRDVMAPTSVRLDDLQV